MTTANDLWESSYRLTLEIPKEVVFRYNEDMFLSQARFEMRMREQEWRFKNQDTILDLKQYIKKIERISIEDCQKRPENRGT